MKKDMVVTIQHQLLCFEWKGSVYQHEKKCFKSNFGTAA